ncbi:MAG: histidine decarboxylase [Planctomycetaceae bacterium]|nr:histidine decarboxylase [Planctomycetaceae bacterium]
MSVVTLGAKFVFDVPQPSLGSDDAQRLDDLFRLYESENERQLGYPCSAMFDYTPLYRFLSFPLNNVGDPFKSSNTSLQTHDLEREVLAVFAQLAHAPVDSYWGYVTSGGTEGNMHGISLARELHPEGVVYHSEDTHYSVTKILRALRVPNIAVQSRPDGSMNLEHLSESIQRHRNRPQIILANIGTTMKGAVDDLPGIREIVKHHAAGEFYIHADAALSGMILPFLDAPPPWDFSAGVDSISISGHKMIGSPFPCGVALARKANVDRIARRIEYTGSLDTTVSGSRNAFAPMFLWYALKTIGVEGFRARVRECMEVAEYACNRLVTAGRNAWRHTYSNTVVFTRPPLAIIQKWQLAVKGEIAHLVTMPHVTRRHIDDLVADLME